MSEVPPPLAPQATSRPLGIVVIVALFIAFALADLALHLLYDSCWWMVSLGMSALLIYLFRKLWIGDEQERKIAVFFGVFLAGLAALSAPELPLQEWPLDEYLWALEGVYGLGAALYLISARRHPFFAARSVP